MAEFGLNSAEEYEELLTNARFDGGNVAVEDMKAELGDLFDDDDNELNAARTAGGNAAVKKLKDELRGLLLDVREKKTLYMANEAGQRPQLMVHVGRILAKLVCLLYQINVVLTVDDVN